MPFPNEHAARVRKPSDFVAKSFRSADIKDGIRVITGTLKRTGRRANQTYRFDRRKFTPQQARNWLRSRKISFILFEKAINE